jgi:AcrR family transcriptional regulator
MRDRRAERRQETIEEIVATAWRLARTEGLAGLSLRELATEVGMRPQSLYTYFDAKHDIYDAMYAQGCRQFVAGQAGVELVGEASADLKQMVRYFISFCTQDPVRYQLMFQRPIPGFEPSAASFAIAVEGLEAAQRHLSSLGIDDPRDLDLFTALGTGLADQQLSNDPGGDRWTRLIDDAVEMYVSHVTHRALLRSPNGAGAGS